MAIALAQSAQNGAANASSVGVAYSSALTAGSFLVATCAVFEGSDGNIGISDTASHTWTAALTEQETSNGSTVLRTWTAPNSGTTTPTVTFTHNANGYYAAVVTEWTGVDSTTPLDGVTTVTASGSTDFSPPTTLSTTNITPNTNNGALIGVMAGDWNTASNPTFTISNGTIVQERESWLTDNAIAVGYKIQTTATAEAITWTVETPSSGSSPWVAHVLVLKESGGTNATATPATIAATIALDATTTTADSSSTPTEIAAVVSLPAPTVTDGTGTADGLDLQDGFSLLLQDGSRLLLQGTVASADATATPATIAALVAFDALTARADSSTTPATIAATATLPHPVVSNGAGLFPTTVSANGRYLEDQNGDPWLAVGDTAWSLVAQCTDAEIETYLEDRAAKGVNLVVLSAPEHFFADNAPNNIDNVAPFTGTAFQSTLNDTYWDRVDFAVTTAEALGITLLICPMYLGFPSTEQGWDTEIVAASNAQMATYGGYLSARYGTAPNIIWLIGHDRVPDATEKARGNALADQLQTDTSQLVSVGGASSTYGGSGSGVTDWASSGVSADLDLLYTYTEQIAEDSYDNWALSPTAPFLFFEGKYENEQSIGDGNVLLREQMWAGWCAGAAGVVFGNDPIWFFDATAGESFGTETGTWVDNLDSGGSNDLAAFATITATLGDGWAAMAADTASTFVTTQGTGTNRVAARFSTNGGLVYHPSFSAGTITLDLTEFSSIWTTVTVTRYDPRSAATTTVGTYATSGTQNLSAPSANSAGDNDWLYVITGAGQTATPATIAVTASLDATTATGSTSATATPADIATTVTLDAVTPQAGATATPAEILATVTLDASTVTTTGTASPAEIAVLAVLDAVAATGSGSATAQPAEILATVTLDTATASGTSSATATPTEILASVVMDAVTAQAGSTAAVTEIATVAVFDAVTATGGSASTAEPATIVASVSFDAATILYGNTATPDTIVVLVSIPVVTATGNGTYAPGYVVVVVRAESRTLTIPADERTLIVPAEARTLEVPDGA